MNADLAQELLNELGSSLENLETQQAALLQFLKDTGVIKDEQFAPYLTQAGKASSVRWRAARVRLDSLISRERDEEEKRAEKEKHPTPPSESPALDQKPEENDKTEQEDKDKPAQEKNKNKPEEKDKPADESQNKSDQTTKHD
jgi:uncharacterized membrane-anchored protein